MLSLVQDFYRHKGMREEVKQYVDDYFTQEAVRMVFERKEVKHLADAKELWDKAFEQMAVDFEVKKEVKNLNEAR